MSYKVLEISNLGIKLLVSKIINNNVEVLFAEETPNFYVDIFNTECQRQIIKDISDLISKAEKFVNEEVNDVALVIPADWVQIKYRRTETLRLNHSLELKKDEIKTLKEQCGQSANPNLKSLFVTPTKITLDNTIVNFNKTKIYKGKKLVMEGIVYYLSKTKLSVIEQIMMKANINCDNYFVSGLGFESSLDQKQVIAIDLGYGKTKVLKYNQGYLFSLEAPIFGSIKIIEKITSIFKIEKQYAKLYLERFGEIPPERIKDNRTIASHFNNDKKIYEEFTMQDLSRIIVNYVDKIFEKVFESIKAILSENTKIYLIGGLSDLKGLKEYIQLKYPEVEIKLQQNANFIGASKSSYSNVINVLKTYNAIKPELNHTGTYDKITSIKVHKSFSNGLIKRLKNILK